jgi:hypothetical protein
VNQLLLFAMGFEVDEGPYFALDELSLDDLLEGVEGLITE